MPCLNKRHLYFKRWCTVGICTSMILRKMKGLLEVQSVLYTFFISWVRFFPSDTNDQPACWCLCLCCKILIISSINPFNWGKGTDTLKIHWKLFSTLTKNWNVLLKPHFSFSPSTHYKLIAFFGRLAVYFSSKSGYTPGISNHFLTMGRSI